LGGIGRGPASNPGAGKAKSGRIQWAVPSASSPSLSPVPTSSGPKSPVGTSSEPGIQKSRRSSQPVVQMEPSQAKPANHHPNPTHAVQTQQTKKAKSSCNRYNTRYLHTTDLPFQKEESTATHKNSGTQMLSFSKVARSLDQH